MKDDLTTAATDAIRAAADRLGVDPFRLARFLANGRLADFLQAAGQAGAIAADVERSARLSHTYLDFLEDEMRRVREQHGPKGPVHAG